MRQKHKTVLRRGCTVKVKTASRRKASSNRWLQRQLNDPYVSAAKKSGYRSRAAFKLIEIDNRFKLFKGKQRVLDLGAAPGSWSQVALSKLPSRAKVLAVDIQELEPLAGIVSLKLDIFKLDAIEIILEELAGKADVVMSDMAAASTGHTKTDHIRIMKLCEIAANVGERVLVENGHFVAKVFKGGTERELLERLKSRFRKVQHVKPQASRAESAEEYVVATGFRS